MRSRSPRRLIVFCVLQFLFCFAASVVCSVPASATNYSLVTLTPEQTLALYGRDLTGQYYKKNSGDILPISFHFVGTTAQWIPTGGNGGFTGSTYCPWVNENDSRDEEVRQKIINTEFLIYRADRYNFSSGGIGDWGGSAWSVNDNGNHANVALGFSINLSNLSYWDQIFLFSYSEYHPNEDSAYDSQLTSVLSDNPAYITYPVHKQAWDRQERSLLAGIPFYQWNRDDGSLIEDRVAYFSIINPSIGSMGFEENYNYISQNLKLNYVGAYDTSFYTAGVAGMEVIPGQTSVFFLIGCPTFSGVDLFPETTTATSGTSGIGSTASYQTFPTVDLSGLESGVGTMVQMQDEQNYYERIQIDQLNTIIEQLNNIYNEMVNRGEVPVSLSDASPYPTLNSDVVADVAGAVTSYTTAQLPDSGNGAAGLTVLSSGLGLFSNEFQVLGVFFLTFSVFTWFIFRGRGQ